MMMENVSFSSNWNPFFYELLDNNSNDNEAAICRSAANSALSFVLMDGNDSAGSPQPSNESPVRLGCFSSMSTTTMSKCNDGGPTNSLSATSTTSSGNNNTAQHMPRTPSSGFVPSDDNDDDVFQPDRTGDDYWKTWNIQTAPGCPALDVLFENKRRWRERFHKSAPPPLQRVCVFCRNTGRSPSLFTSHVIRNELGEITCPVLSSKFCHKCGVQGHTANYCYTDKKNSKTSSTGMSRSSSRNVSMSDSSSSVATVTSNNNNKRSTRHQQQNNNRQFRQMPAYSWR